MTQEGEGAKIPYKGVGTNKSVGRGLTKFHHPFHMGITKFLIPCMGGSQNPFSRDQFNLVFCVLDFEYLAWIDASACFLLVETIEKR